MGACDREATLPQLRMHHTFPLLVLVLVVLLQLSTASTTAAVMAMIAP